MYKFALFCLLSNYLAKAKSLLRLKAIQTRSHSHFTASSQRNRNWRKPMTDFIMPKTGSMVLFDLHRQLYLILF